MGGGRGEGGREGLGQRGGGGHWGSGWGGGWEAPTTLSIHTGVVHEVLGGGSRLHSACDGRQAAVLLTRPYVRLTAALCCHRRRCFYGFFKHGGGLWGREPGGTGLRRWGAGKQSEGGGGSKIQNPHRTTISDAKPTSKKSTQNHIFTFYIFRCCLTSNTMSGLDRWHLKKIKRRPSKP